MTFRSAVLIENHLPTTFHYNTKHLRRMRCVSLKSQVYGIYTFWCISRDLSSSVIKRRNIDVFYGYALAVLLFYPRHRRCNLQRNIVYYSGESAPWYFADFSATTKWTSGTSVSTNRAGKPTREVYANSISTGIQTTGREKYLGHLRVDRQLVNVRPRPGVIIGHCMP